MKLIDFFAGRIHNRGKRRPAKKSINFIGYITLAFLELRLEPNISFCIIKLCATSEHCVIYPPQSPDASLNL